MKNEKCPTCKEKVTKNPNKNDYMHYAYYCNNCDLFLFSRQVKK